MNPNLPPCSREQCKKTPFMYFKAKKMCRYYRKKKCTWKAKSKISGNEYEKGELSRGESGE